MALVVCGDPVVGRLLVLLLEDSGYEVRFMPRLSLNESGALERVRLLLLTPTPELSSERRAALLASLKDIQEAVGLIVLELVTPSEERRREEVRDDSRGDSGGDSGGDSWHLVPWPCRFPELKRRIEAALLANSGPGADPAAKSHELEDKEDDA
jgi:hypothetical protein